MKYMYVQFDCVKLGKTLVIVHADDEGIQANINYVHDEIFTELLLEHIKVKLTNIINIV